MAAPLSAVPTSTRRTFGSGEIYYNGVHVGQGKNATLEIVETPVYQESGRPLIKAVKSIIRQEARMTFQAAELQTTNLRQALNLYQATTGAVFYEAEGVPVTLTATDPIAIGRTNICKADGTAAADTDITVTSIDGATTYTGADYDLVAAAGTLARTVASTIPDGATVIVKFAWNQANAQVTHAGGLATCSSVVAAEMRFIYRFPNCDQMEVVFPKASPAGGLNVTFDSENFTTHDLVFEALADLSRAPGFRLWYAQMMLPTP